MPFYETGLGSSKAPLSAGDDIQIMACDLLEEVAAAHRSMRRATCPIHTGRTVFACRAIFDGAGPQTRRSSPGPRNARLWLYRGAWQEWAAHEIEMAVPLSPRERSSESGQAIFKHESQKDHALFPAPGTRASSGASRGPKQANR